MKYIKQKYYEKVIYPQFIANVEKVWDEKNILVRLKFEEERLQVYYIIDNKIIKIEKSITGSLNYNETKLSEVIKSEVYQDLPNFIKDVKLNAEIISSQNMVDFISHSFKEAISYYKLSRKDYQLIFQTILNYRDFFKFNTPALVIHNEGIKNKWID